MNSDNAKCILRVSVITITSGVLLIVLCLITGTISFERALTSEEAYALDPCEWRDLRECALQQNNSEAALRLANYYLVQCNI